MACSLTTNIARNIVQASRALVERASYLSPIMHGFPQPLMAGPCYANTPLPLKAFDSMPITPFEEGLATTVERMKSSLRTSRTPRPAAPIKESAAVVTSSGSSANCVLQAMERGEFSLVYQPIVEVATGRISALEALLRHEHEGVLSAPFRLIKSAEATGAIIPLGAWVIQTACADAAELFSRVPAVRFSVNISMPQLEDAGFPSIIKQALSKYQLPPKSLELEVTERILMREFKKSRAIVRELQEMGVSIALDDFGCGYANLQQLCRIHVDRLKTDRSILRSSSRRWPLFDGVVAFARQLNLPIVAEGIETSRQLDKVIHAQCEEAQGYLLGRPMSLADTIRRLKMPSAVA